MVELGVGEDERVCLGNRGRGVLVGYCCIEGGVRMEIRYEEKKKKKKRGKKRREEKRMADSLRGNECFACPCFLPISYSRRSLLERVLYLPGFICPVHLETRKT